MNEKARRLIITATALKPGSVIVEIGSIRNSVEIPSDGYSTFYLTHFAVDSTHNFYTVDSSEASSNTVREVLGDLASEIGIVTMDGAEFLKGFNKPIDLLFLDGSADPQESLEQFEAADLSPDAIVVIDDVQAIDTCELGKGEVLLHLLSDLGYEIAIYPTEPGYRMAVCR